MEAFMNKRLKEIQISIKDLKKKIPTSNECLNIRVHWNNDEDLTFEVKIPLNKNFNKRR
jgi:hypothetical protein